MSYAPCPNENEACRFYEEGCYSDLHHSYYPRKRYTTSIERTFRNLPENKEMMCRDEHSELHATEQPPHKPRREEMLQAIAAHIIEVAS
jgi:hypothetical protein